VTRSRRAALVIGLAIILGAMAATDVGRREAELRDRVGDPVPVVVAERDLAAGDPIDVDDLGVREVPRRYAPRERVERPDEVAGLRPWSVVRKGADVTPGALVAADGSRLRPGERDPDVVVVGDEDDVRPGVRVDVLAVYGGAGRSVRGRVMLEDGEVLDVGPAASVEEGSPERLRVKLRTTARQALELLEAQQEATELRVLVRAPGDDGRVEGDATDRSGAR